MFFLPSFGGGGAERVLMTLLRKLDRRVIHPHLVVMRGEGPHASRVPSDIDVVILGARSLWTVVPKLTAVIRRATPDVLVATTGGASVPAVIAHGLARSNARLVLWERSVLVGSEVGVKRSFLLFLKQRLYPRANLVTAVAKAVEDDLWTHVGLDRSQTRVVYNPIVDDELDQLSRESVEHPWFSEPTPVILCVARLVPLKDHVTLLRAFARLRRDRAVRLAILGDGPLRVSLEREAKSLGVESSVWFGGFVENPFKYMRKSAVLVLSSLHEGLPGVIVQAMACGVPVVATKSRGGTTELVQDGSTGLLVPVQDPEALSEAVARILDDVGLAQQLTREARKLVAKFRVTDVVSEYERAIVGS